MKNASSVIPKKVGMMRLRRVRMKRSMKRRIVRAGTARDHPGGPEVSFPDDATAVCYGA
jgi:hypothetical protein